jgi:hypothetical protein
MNLKKPGYRKASGVNWGMFMAASWMRRAAA